MNRRDRRVVVLRPPAELPTTTADGPCAEADPCDLQSCAPERGGLELCGLHLPENGGGALGSHCCKQASPIPRWLQFLMVAGCDDGRPRRRHRVPPMSLRRFTT